VQRAPHGPGFDERPVVPQRALNCPPVQVFNPRPDGQLGRGHYLGVQATEATDDREHAARGRTLIKVMAPDAPGRHSWPSQFEHLRRITTRIAAMFS
jgi:hypothetical protein